jgi:hypothetical protein
MNQYDEGSKCKDTNCSGILELEKVENCSCHISPPCHSCMELRLLCNECGHDPNLEEK